MTRSNSHLQLVCTLVGGLWALSWAMTARQCPVEPLRVPIGASLPVVFAGRVAGFCVGCAARRLTSGRSAWLRVALIVVMTASVAAPIGWLLRIDWRDKSGLMAISDARTIGAGVGLALAAAGEMRWRPRRASLNSPG